MKFYSILLIITLITNVFNHSTAQLVGVGTTVPASKLDIAGDLSLRENALALVAGNNNNINLATTKNSFYRIGIIGATFTVTGFTGGNDGRILILYNASGQTMTVANLTTSAAANQIITGTGGNMNIPTAGTVSLIYNSTDTKWVVKSTNPATTGWGITGNAGTLATTNFIGTIDSVDFVTRTNNIEWMRVTAFGNVGIGTPTPITQLHVAGRTPTGVLSSIATLANPRRINVQGRFTYVANGNSNSLLIYDVSNPTTPALISTTATGTNTHAAYTQGKYCYVITSNPSNSLQIFEISNPTSPILVSTTIIGNAPTDIKVQGKYAYVINYFANTFQIFDVSNATSPALISTMATGLQPHGIYVQSRYAYIANALGNSFQIFDVNNPNIPVLLSTSSTVTNAVDVYVQGKYAYVGCQGANILQIFDVSNPSAPTLTGSFAGGNAYSVFVQGRFAYLCDNVGSNFYVVDVSNPSAPVLFGSFPAFTPFSVFVQGRYAYILSIFSATLQVFDLGGAYIQQIEAGGIETGTMQLRNNLTVNNDADIKGGLVVGENTLFQGDVSVNGGVAITGTDLAGIVSGTYDNVVVGKNSFIRISSATGNFTLTGLCPGVGMAPSDGHILTIYNTTNNNMTLANLTGTSSINNQIVTLTGGNISTAGVGGSVVLQYSSLQLKWIVIAFNP